MSLDRPYEYPFKGIRYLFVHRQLWRKVFFGVFISIIMCLLTYILLFMYAFPNQAEGLSKYVTNWLSWLISFVLTLYEIQTSMIILNILMISYLMTNIFDRIWKNELNNSNHEINEELLNERRENSSRYYSCLKTFFILFLFRSILMILTYPLNIIPIIGTIAFVYINGYYYGWSLHIRYFDLIGLTYKQGKHYVNQHRSSYIKFGIVSMIFDLIPILNFISPITNVIGSALWACDIEKYENSLTHPRSYLICPSQDLIQQQNQYGSIQNEKHSIDPPNYEQVIQENLNPSAPPFEKQ